MKPPRESERSLLLARQMGDSLIAWSQIESLWNRIFQRLLFYDLGLRPFDAPRNPSEPFPQEDRANALWDALASSAAQLDLVTALAPVVLITPEQKPVLDLILKLASETHTMRGLRNAIAHGPFEKNVDIWEARDGTYHFSRADISMPKRTHPRLRGKDPYAEIPKALAEFQALYVKVWSIMSWFLTGKLDGPRTVPLR